MKSIYHSSERSFNLEQSSITIEESKTYLSRRVKSSWDEECESLGLLRRVVVVAGAVVAAGVVDAFGCVGTIGAVDAVGAVGAFVVGGDSVIVVVVWVSMSVVEVDVRNDVDVDTAVYRCVCWSMCKDSFFDTFRIRTTIILIFMKKQDTIHFYEKIFYEDTEI